MMIFKRRTIDADVEEALKGEKEERHVVLCSRLYDMLPVIGDMQIYRNCRQAFPTEPKVGIRAGVTAIFAKYASVSGLFYVACTA